MTGRANHKRGFGWVVPYMKSRVGYAWHPDSQLATHARAGRNAKRRDSKRARAAARRDVRQGES